MAEFRDTNDFIERKRAYATLSRLLITDANGSNMITNYEDGWTSAISKAMDVIMDSPAADVRPERHGEWVDIGDGYVACSECGEEHGWQDYRASYCDTCGAKMSWEDNDT